MQIAGLISAMMAMIVTLALGFLLEPLPRVRLNYNDSLGWKVDSLCVKYMGFGEPFSSGC